MISPKYALTHYWRSKVTKAPHVVNLYLDYNCPFSGKLFQKLLKVIPALDEKHPGGFQFVFVNVIQPWHPNSVLLHEYSLVVAQLLREKVPEKSNELFWGVSNALFSKKEEFYDSATVSLGRNDIYKKINETVYAAVSLPFDKADVLKKLEIPASSSASDASNDGNGATVDVKYFTKYLRGVGVHVTPTVSVDGIVDGSVSSGSSPEELTKVFEGHL
ncbi:uncharacterized protein CXQ87_001488 [Candidozyma duobushaemuli]|uniref:Thioredoxin-like fold domain-containing protein n=2 Tax=Candidozyma TaxID=3303203 RepID=A0ABX8I5D4_9ASCO|nr:uncharacterized protein CXQ87_001488 [[Candida] duobushaemulonis]PVH18557.1 hypothetical protein CXQ87_001488 [[Candida] duobushaemulonis]QWU87078.1 hypothetical protein CA3LBN_001296 [[Candida] haemuloni]